MKVWNIGAECRPVYEVKTARFGCSLSPDSIPDRPNTWGKVFVFKQYNLATYLYSLVIAIWCESTVVNDCDSARRKLEVYGTSVKISNCCNLKKSRNFFELLKACLQTSAKEFDPLTKTSVGSSPQIHVRRSKSWTRASLNTPPDTLRYERGLRGESLLLALMTWTFPISPAKKQWLSTVKRSTSQNHPL